jgi:hypothetical protein
VLNFNRALHGIDRTREFSQEVIARGIDHPTTVLLDERGHYLPIGCERTDRRLFIVPHEAAVAFDIGTENGGELAFHTHPPRKRLSYRQRPFVKRRRRLAAGAVVYSPLGLR